MCECGKCDCDCCVKNCDDCVLLQNYDEYEEQEKTRAVMKLKQLEDLFNAIFGFYIPFVWGSYMPTKQEHEDRIKAAIKAVKELDK